MSEEIFVVCYWYQGRTSLRRAFQSKESAVEHLRGEAEQYDRDVEWYGDDLVEITPEKNLEIKRVEMSENSS